MLMTRKYLMIVLLIAFTVSCKHKKKPALSGDDPVDIDDFIEFFQPASLPYQVTDSVFLKRNNDSLLISNKVFTQFVPDSLLSKIYGKGSKVKIYPMARITASGEESYLFAKSIGGDKKTVYILCFDKKKKFIAGLPIMKWGGNNSQSVVLDRKRTITRTVLRKNADGSTSEGKDVYVLNAAAGNFMLIMTDALDDNITELINPIDTLPHKNKFSADYTAGKMNLVSIRDGRKPGRFTFFIHFEKNNGECTGELKGEAIWRSATMAEYREDGEPCVLRFNFAANTVSLAEEQGCGSNRGLRCLFDGNFTRKKEVKPKTKISKRK
jgi:hypothetical protein